MKKSDFKVEHLGENKISSPYKMGKFVDDDARIAYDAKVSELEKYAGNLEELPSFELAGVGVGVF